MGRDGLREVIARLEQKIANLLFMLCQIAEHPFSVPECGDQECHICGMIACPMGDPGHFSSEGCASEDFEDEIEV